MRTIHLARAIARTHSAPESFSPASTPADRCRRDEICPERERLGIHHFGRRASLPRAIARAGLAHGAKRDARGRRRARLRSFARGLRRRSGRRAAHAKRVCRSRTIRGVQFIDDSYNANPDSMKAALRDAGRTGDGRTTHRGARRNGELGAESERGHREVGETRPRSRIDASDRDRRNRGDDRRRAAQTPAWKTAQRRFRLRRQPNFSAENRAPGDLVLIKGSRAARTERVLEEFARRQSAEGIAS